MRWFWKGELKSDHRRTCLDMEYAFYFVCRGALERFDVDLQFTLTTLVTMW